MVKSDKISTLINALIEKTKLQEIKWERMPSYLEKHNNEPLRQYFITKNKYLYSTRPDDPVPMEYNTFCAEFNNGVISILSFNSRSNIHLHILAIQPSIDSSLNELNEIYSHQDELTALVLFVSNKLDDAEAFINAIIGEDE